MGRAIVREIEIELQNNKKTRDYNHVDSNEKSSLTVARKILRGIGEMASQATRTTVYKAGKTIGYKFKPWEAFRIAGKIRNFVPVLAIGGVAIDCFLIGKEQTDENNREKELRDKKAEVEQEYRNLAEEIKNEYLAEVETTIQFYDEELFDVNLKRNEIINNDISKEEIVNCINEQLRLVKDAIRKLTRLSNEESLE